MSEIDEIKLRSDLLLILKAEYTRTFQCSECGYEEHAVPAIVGEIEAGFVAVYGSGVDMCTHCSKWREDYEETTDSPAYYDESEGEFTDDYQLQAET